MKVKQNVSSQLLILALAALVIVLMIQMAQAQDMNSNNGGAASIAQATQTQGQSGTGQGQYLQMKMPKKSLGSRILENTTLSYYQQFLGPTLSGPSSETYNVFQEGVNDPGTGRAPLQSFHAVNLRYQINSDWAVGASLAAVNGYTPAVESKSKYGPLPHTNRPDDEFFNARAYVVLPSWNTRPANFFTTVAYEAPTSVISRNDGMTGGLVLIENMAFNLPNRKWSVGVLGQYWRAYFRHDRNVKPPQGPGYLPTQLQTVIISGGPYANYRWNDNWMTTSSIILDWDQRGVQTDSREFNNNLPHRGRLGMTYFPTKLKYLSSVGVFAQALLKFRPDTTAVGADFLLRF